LCLEEEKKMAHITKAIQQKKVVLDFQDKKKWTKFTPEERLRTYRKCGQPCFAKAIDATSQEILADPEKTLQFPICRVPSPKTKKCKVSAAGLLAARRRAILTKKYPKIEKQLSKIITTMGTTDKARTEMEIKKVLVNETPLPNGKHIITIVYMDGIKSSKEYTKGHILRKYGNYLSKALLKRLNSK